MKFDQIGTLATSRQANDLPLTELQIAFAAAGQYGNAASTTSATIKNSVPGWETETLRQLFENLVVSWMRATKYSNSMTEILENESLSRIMSLGPSVVPLILEDLEKSPKHWFYALTQLTGEDPVAEDHAGNLQSMRNDWLAWGRERGLVR